MTDFNKELLTTDEFSLIFSLVLKAWENVRSWHCSLGMKSQSSTFNWSIKGMVRTDYGLTV